MTRKDFQLIADVVSEIDNVDTRNQVALNFVTTLDKTNSRFDSVRFLLACKVNIKNKVRGVNDDDESRRKENFIAP
jgi:hypothetical protein